MQFIANTSMPGIGRVTGVFYNSDRSVVAVSTAFDRLTNPPARAAYGGQRLLYRVALYQRTDTKPLAVFDRLVFPINHIAFHPSEPTISIATGRYDGGWSFEGELVVWNWERGEHTTEIWPIPEVVHSRFCDDGTCIIALVRPWNEDMAEIVGDPFDSFFEFRAAYSADLFDGIFNKDSITQQLSGQSPKSARDLVAFGAFKNTAEDPKTALRQAFGIRALDLRSAIWDVAWIGGGDIALVHDDCQLEILSPDGDYLNRFVGAGYGAQIFRRPKPVVHVVHQDDAAESWPSSFRLAVYAVKALH